MRFDAIPRQLIDLMAGRIWHATDHRRLQEILVCGLLPTASQRKAWAGRCRAWGGVSVFDFRGMDYRRLSQITEANPDWTGWLGENGGSRCVAWIELREGSVAERVTPPKEFWERHLSAQAEEVKKNPIAHVEACHSGPVPAEAFGEVLLLNSHDSKLYKRMPSAAAALDALPDFLELCPDEWPDRIDSALRVPSLLAAQDITETESRPSLAEQIRRAMLGPEACPDTSEELREALVRVGMGMQKRGEN